MMKNYGTYTTMESGWEVEGLSNKPTKKLLTDVKKRKPRNRFEARIYATLKRAKAKFAYESEKIPYILAKHYLPDFIITTALGKIYLECKGYLRPEDKQKMVAVKRQNPWMDLRILFYAPNKRYIAWAERNGIRYAISKIPKEWLDGL